MNHLRSSRDLALWARAVHAQSVGAALLSAWASAGYLCAVCSSVSVHSEAGFAKILQLLGVQRQGRGFWRGVLGLCAAIGVAQAAMAQPVGAELLSATPGRSQTKPVHTGHGGGRPQLATGATFSPDGRLWVVGLNAQRELFVQSTVDASLQTWAQAQRLDSGSDTILAEGENRPKIAWGPQGQVVITYTQTLDKPYTCMVRMLRSVNGGQTFGAATTLHQDRQEITHCFESIAFDTRGDLHAVWVDKRDKQAQKSPNTYVGAAIYHNVSHDGGASFGPDLKLADHSCECCRIALAPDAQGRLHAMWRQVFGQDTRDHALGLLDTVQVNRFTRATYDEWHINACPHHGPSLATASGEAGVGFHALWFGLRAAQAGGSVRYARLDTSGAPLPGTEQVLPDERAEHADMVAHGPKVAVVWRSSQGAVTTLSAWLSRDGGRSFERRQLDQVSGYNDFPRLVQSGERMVVVWRTPLEVKTHELVF